MKQTVYKIHCLVLLLVDNLGIHLCHFYVGMTEQLRDPYPEIKVTPEIRQEGYEKFVTTDDHLMHITGIAKDQNGTKYYITKNSWGADGNKFGGLPDWYL